jgi:hypothetical protein
VADFPTHLYRLRSADRALSEVKDCVLRFASPGTLNDPMEGYVDFHWGGDRILWRNVLKHYLLCLTWTIGECAMLPDETDWTSHRINVRLDPVSLPVGFQQLFDDVQRNFFAHEAVAQLITLLESHAEGVTSEGVRWYLHMLSHFARDTVERALARCGSSAEPVGVHASLGAIETELLETISQLSKLPRDGADPRLQELTFALSNHHTRQAHLALSYNFRDRDPAKRDIFIQSVFVDRYLECALESFVRPLWYAACFLTDCTNASIWGSYADSHMGVALKFNVRDVKGEPGMVVQEGGPRARHEIAFREVKYSATPVSRDFFDSIAQPSAGEIRKFWYTDENGVESPRAKRFDDPKRWHKEYWDAVLESATTKLPDWKHETEYRLVLIDTVGAPADYKTTTYDFADLAGIVFGARTSLKDRIALIQAVEKQCVSAKRTDFEFSQMVYSRHSKRLVELPLKWIRFDLAKP